MGPLSHVLPPLCLGSFPVICLLSSYDRSVQFNYFSIISFSGEKRTNSNILWEHDNSVWYDNKFETAGFVLPWPTWSNDLEISLGPGFPFYCTVLTPGVSPQFLETLTSCVFTVSFISNLLSAMFREATCGECIYRRSDPLKGWLRLGFGDWRPVSVNAVSAIVGTPRVNTWTIHVLCLSLLVCVCLSHYPGNHCFINVTILQKDPTCCT